MKQALPAAETEQLSHLHRTAMRLPPGPDRRRACRRLAGYIQCLHQAGWARPTIGRALGMTGEAVRQYTVQYPPDDECGPYPPVTSPARREARQLGRLNPAAIRPLPPPIRDRLTDLLTTSRQRTGQKHGAGKETEPWYRASRDFAALVNGLLDSGHYNQASIARDLGLNPNSIRHRLAVQGHRPYVPSQAPRRQRKTPVPPLPAEVRQRLQDLRKPGDPSNSSQFAAVVHDLITNGPHTLRSIGRDLGVYDHAIRLRLARHGYLPFPPSAAPKGDPRQQGHDPSRSTPPAASPDEDRNSAVQGPPGAALTVR